eukprot:gene14567-19558_t
MNDDCSVANTRILVYNSNKIDIPSNSAYETTSKIYFKRNDSIPHSVPIVLKNLDTNYKKNKYKPNKKLLRSIPSTWQGNNYNENENLVNNNHRYINHQNNDISKILDYVRKGQTNIAINLFKSLIQNNQTVSMDNIAFQHIKHSNPNIVVRDYNMLIRELGDRGEMDYCRDLLSIMKNAPMHLRIRPTLVTYSTLISRAGTWQKTQLAQFYFNDMIASNIQPDIQAYNSLMNAYAKNGNLQQSLNVLSMINHDKYINSSVITFNTLIDSCARTGNVTFINDILLLMKKANISPNQRTYSSIIHTCCQGGQLQTAYNLLQIMEEKGFEPNEITYSLLLDSLGKNGDIPTILQLLDYLSTKGFYPNVVILTSLITACGKNGQLDLAFKIYYYMLSSENFQPNSVTSSSLVDLCLKYKLINEAFIIVQLMKQENIMLTEVTYTSLISELTKLKQLDRILEIVANGEPYEGTPPPRKTPSFEKAVFPTSAKTIKININNNNNNDNSNNDNNYNENSISTYKFSPEFQKIMSLLKNNDYNKNNNDFDNNFIFKNNLSNSQSIIVT